ncbi:MAG: tetratricopeptide repeat protein [Candidatus Omnitrophota bacterium]
MQERIKKILKVLFIIVVIIFVVFQFKPRLAPYFINKGIKNFEENDLNQALLFLKTASALDPDKPVIHFKLAQIYQNKRSFYQAIEEYKKAIKSNPQYAEASVGLAEIYIEIGRHDDALLELNETLKLAPENQKVKEMMELAKYDYTQSQLDKAAKAYMRKERDEAREILKNAAGLQPDYLFNLFVVENILTKKESTNKDITVLEKIVKWDPEYRIVYRLLGDSWLKNLEFKKAISAYEKYLTIEPNDASIHNNLGVCYNRLELLDKSIEQYRIALSLLPDNQNVIYGLASSYRQKEMYEEAIKLYNHLLKLDANIAYAYLDLAKIYKNTEKPDEAKKNLDEAIKIAKDNLQKNPADEISRRTIDKANSLLEELPKDQTEK